MRSCLSARVRAASPKSAPKLQVWSTYSPVEVDAAALVSKKGHMSPKLHHRSKHVVPLKSAQCSVGEVKYRRSTRVVFAEVVGVSRRRRTESKCTFACMSVCICGGISVCMYIHACMCVCVCVRARTFLYAIYPYTHTLQKYTNACTLYTYISMHVHIHIHICIDSLAPKLQCHADE